MLPLRPLDSLTSYNASQLSGAELFSAALVNALIIIAAVIGVTILCVVLFYVGFHKVRSTFFDGGCDRAVCVC